MRTTYMPNAAKVERKWYVVDAEGKNLGRLASEIAKVLRGKNKPIYTSFVDTGDYVIVINADKIAAMTVRIFSAGRNSLMKTYALFRASLKKLSEDFLKKMLNV